MLANLRSAVPPPGPCLPGLLTNHLNNVPDVNVVADMIPAQLLLQASKTTGFQYLKKALPAASVSRLYSHASVRSISSTTHSEKVHELELVCFLGGGRASESSSSTSFSFSCGTSPLSEYRANFHPRLSVTSTSPTHRSASPAAARPRSTDASDPQVQDSKSSRRGQNEGDTNDK